MALVNTITYSTNCIPITEHFTRDPLTPNHVSANRLSACRQYLFLANELIVIMPAMPAAYSYQRNNVQ